MFVVLGCQNAAVVKESEIRSNFGGYCKLTSGIYDPDNGIDICICGNYRCHNQACNFEGDNCDKRKCYEGDQRCTEDNIIQTCEFDKNDGHQFNADENKEISCEKFSCTQNDQWHFSCGVCLNNDFKCEPDKDNITGQLSVCQEGRWLNIKQCDGGCYYDEIENRFTNCISCAGEYCVNGRNQIGEIFNCNNRIIKTCTKDDQPVSCNYSGDISDCGKCLDNTKNCIQVPKSNIYISNQICRNGTYDNDRDLGLNEWKLFLDKYCTIPIEHDTCLDLKETISKEQYGEGTIYFYDCETNDSCIFNNCHFDCNVKHDGTIGCLAENQTGDCLGEDVVGNCGNVPDEKPPCVCSTDEQCSECPSCQTDSAVCLCDDTGVCTPHPICTESSICPENSKCTSEGTCMTGCTDEMCIKPECDYLRCILNSDQNEIQYAPKLYCDTSAIDSNDTTQSDYPYIKLISSDQYELHIDGSHFDILYTLSSSNNACLEKINTIVLYGNPNDNKFKIACQDMNTHGSIHLPPAITTIKGDKNDPIIECNEVSDTLHNSLFDSLNNVTLADFGLNIQFEPEGESTLQGGLANTIANSTMNNISIAGSIHCTADSCGLLAGTVQYTKDHNITDMQMDIKGIDDSETNKIGVYSKNNHSTVGGLIGHLIMQSPIKIVKEDESPFNFSHINIESVDGQSNTGGLIGLLELSLSGIEIRNTMFNFNSISVNKISGSNNVGGIIGHIDPQDSGNTKIIFSDVRIGNNDEKSDTIAIAGNDNVGGFIGSIGCKKNESGKDECKAAANPPITITGKHNILNGTVNGMNNVGGVIGIASMLSGVKKFTLNDSDDLNDLRGSIIGGKTDLYDEIMNNKQKIENVYKSENIGGVIGKLVINGPGKESISFDNIKIRLDRIICSEYEDRLTECTNNDNQCPTAGLCAKQTQCRYGGNIIGSIDITKKTESEILTINNIDTALNTLAISTYSGGISGYIINKDEIDKYKYGVISISDILLVIKKVEARFDLFGKFRSIITNHSYPKQLNLNQIVAIVKLANGAKQNYCLYHGEYNGVGNSSLCLLSSATIDGLSSSAQKTNVFCNSDENCFRCAEEYVNNYPNFLVYGPDCKDDNNHLKLACFINNDSVYFYQFNQYSTAHQAYEQTFNGIYGECFTNSTAQMCIHLQRDCANKKGDINGIGSSVNLYCCGDKKGGYCKGTKKENDVCIAYDITYDTDDKAKTSCETINKDNITNSDMMNHLHGWETQPIGTLTVDMDKGPIYFPTPPICLNDDKSSDPNCQKPTGP